MYDLTSNHAKESAAICRHSLHFSALPRTQYCPQCTITAAQADLERTRKKFEGEGGAHASAFMRDRAWNIARLQCAATKRKVQRIMRKDWQRQERERLWDEAHQWYLSKHVDIPFDLETCSPCIVCATLKKQSRPYTKPVVSLTTAWWEHEGALVEEELTVPETPPCSLAKAPRPHQSQPRANQPSCIAGLIKSWRSMRAVSDEQRRIWEDRYKLDRAIRRKYDLPDDYEIEAELFENPIPASHARYHHRQLQNGEHAAERRAKRHKRRTEDYRPCRSSLALSELVDDVNTDEAGLESLRLEEEAAELRRLAGVVATEVGYLYFVGEIGLLERWRDDVERSNLDLIQRQTENGVQVGEEHDGEEQEMGL